MYHAAGYYIRPENTQEDALRQQTATHDNEMTGGNSTVHVVVLLLKCNINTDARFKLVSLVLTKNVACMNAKSAPVPGSWDEPARHPRKTKTPR